MPLQQNDIEKLKQLYKEDFQEELSDKEAWAMANRLLNFYRLLQVHPRKR